MISDALRTTGATRRFTDEPVPHHIVAELLDVARFAPSGGNRQPWRVAVVTDPAVRRRLAELMQPVWNEYVARAATGRTPFSVLDDVPAPAAPHTDNELLDHVETVPVVLAVAADLGRIAMVDTGLDRPALTGGASIYPFCWSILLAARERGLGGVLTTFLSRVEDEAATVLGLPAGHALAATIFLGVPERQVTRLRRHEVDTFATVDRFDGPAFMR